MLRLKELGYARANSSTSQCDICKSHRFATPSEYFCLQCHKKLCNGHARKHEHEKLFEQHVLVPVTETLMQELTCTRHGSRDALVYQCMDCQTPLCTTCALSTHDTHAKVNLNQHLVQARKTFHQTLKTATAKYTTGYQMKVRLEAQVAYIQHMYQKTNSLIRAQYEWSKKVLEDRHKVLQEDLLSLQKAYVQTVNFSLDSLSHDMSKLKQYSGVSQQIVSDTVKLIKTNPNFLRDFQETLLQAYECCNSDDAFQTGDFSFTPSYDMNLGSLHGWEAFSPHTFDQRYEIHSKAPPSSSSGIEHDNMMSSLSEDLVIPEMSWDGFTQPPCLHMVSTPRHKKNSLTHLASSSHGQLQSFEEFPHNQSVNSQHDRESHACEASPRSASYHYQTQSYDEFPSSLASDNVPEYNEDLALCIRPRGNSSASTDSLFRQFHELARSLREGETSTDAELNADELWEKPHDDIAAVTRLENLSAELSAFPGRISLVYCIDYDSTSSVHMMGIDLNHTFPIDVIFKNDHKLVVTHWGTSDMKNSAASSYIHPTRISMVVYSLCEGAPVALTTFTGTTPWALTDHNGLTYVSDTRATSRTIVKYSESGEALGCWPIHSFCMPKGIAVLADGQFVVSDSLKKQVFVCQERGKNSMNISATLGKGRRTEHLQSRHSNADHPLFQCPDFVTCTPDGRIAVSDTEANAVFVFSRDGTYLYSLETGHATDDRLDRPMGICSDINGNLLVADAGNNRVCCYNREGEFAGVLLSSRTNGIYEPRGISGMGHTLAVVGSDEYGKPLIMVFKVPFVMKENVTPCSCDWSRLAENHMDDY